MSAAAQPTAKAIAELRNHPHWVVWREERRDGKPTKVPYQAVDVRVRARSTDPETWSAYGYAANAVERGQAAGVGYVFSADDDYAGVDLDKCVVDGKVDPHAMDIVRRLDSYTELSPSGTGLHVIVRGRIIGDRKRTGKTPWGGEFESYDQGRFFTVTERHLEGTPTTIEARQDELDAVRAQMFPVAESKPSRNGTATDIEDDEELLRKARGAKNGREFDALYGGDTSRHGDDESAADLALCNMLSFWTGPYPDRIDRLFRSSGLMRDKWDSSRPGGTYGSETIDKALADRTEFYSGPNGTRPTRAEDGREGAEQDARDELARMLGLEPHALGVAKVIRYGRDSKARVEIHVTDGSVLELDPIGAYSAAAKFNLEVAIQIGAEPTLKPSHMTRIGTLIRTAGQFCEATTLDDRAADCGISFLQEARTRSVDMNDQTDRFNAFVELAAKNPVLTAGKDDTSISSESVVLEDPKTGLRYVRVQWFHAFAKAQHAPGGAEDIVRRMSHLGWTKPGKDGRIKATAPGGGDALQWAFFVVSAEWEKR
jgi:putative DNA primase/helicase